MKTSRAIALVGLAVALAAAPRPARAQSAPEHVARGTRSYNLQDWPTALEEYKKAYALDPKASTLWAIAQVQRLSGDCRGAVFTYKAYIRGASASGANAAQDLVSKCEATLAAQQQAVDAAAATPAPPATDAPAAPPQKDVLAPPPTPVVPEKPKAPTPWILDPLGDVLAVVGLGGLVTGGVFLTLGDVAMADAANRTSYQAYDHDVSVARTQQQVGVGVAIGGAVFAGLAIWRFVAVASRASKERAAAHAAGVTVTPLPGGVFTSYSAHF